MEETTPAVSRRRLLRRAGTVAAGVGAAGLASTVAASPAQAVDVPVLLDQQNLGAGTTGIKGGTAASVAVTLGNDNGPALALKTHNQLINASNFPLGTVYTDDDGDILMVGRFDPANPESSHFVNAAYSQNWAQMPIPVQSFRLVDTRGPNDGSYDPSFGFGRFFLSSATYDAQGRVNPKFGNASTPDMIIKLDSIFDFAGETFTAIQANLACASQVENGWAALYSGTFQGTASINYGPAQFAISNMTQTAVPSSRQINFKTQAKVVVVLDVIGYIVAHPGQLLPGAFGTSATASAAAAQNRKMAVRPNRKKF